MDPGQQRSVGNWYNNQMDVSVSSTGSDIRQRLQGSLNMYPAHSADNKSPVAAYAPRPAVAQSPMNMYAPRNVVPMSPMEVYHPRHGADEPPIEEEENFPRRNVMQYRSESKESLPMNTVQPTVPSWVSRNPHLAALLQPAASGEPPMLPPLFRRQALSASSSPLAGWSIPAPVLFGLGSRASGTASMRN